MFFFEAILKQKTKKIAFLILSTRNYYKPVFGLFHLYIRVKCIIIYTSVMGLERLNITIPDSEKKKKQFNLPQRPQKVTGVWEREKQN